MTRLALDTDDLDAIDTVTLASYAFTVSIMEISDDFKRRIVDGYQADHRWRSVISTLQEAQDQADPIQPKLPYHLGPDGLLFFVNAEGDEKLCMPQAMTGENFHLIHDRQAHQGFNAAWHKLQSSGLVFYKGVKLLKKYIKLCPECRMNAAPRHRPYGSLQPVLSPPIPFHTITLDIVTGLPEVLNPGVFFSSSFSHFAPFPITIPITFPSSWIAFPSSLFMVSPTPSELEFGERALLPST